MDKKLKKLFSTKSMRYESGVKQIIIDKKIFYKYLFDPKLFFYFYCQALILTEENKELIGYNSLTNLGRKLTVQAEHRFSCVTLSIKIYGEK